jgi:hypothetical protein
MRKPKYRIPASQQLPDSRSNCLLRIDTYFGSDQTSVGANSLVSHSSPQIKRKDRKMQQKVASCLPGPPLPPPCLQYVFSSPVTRPALRPLKETTVVIRNAKRAAVHLSQFSYPRNNSKGVWYLTGLSKLDPDMYVASPDPRVFDWAFAALFAPNHGFSSRFDCPGATSESLHSCM